MNTNDHRQHKNEALKVRTSLRGPRLGMHFNHNEALKVRTSLGGPRLGIGINHNESLRLRLG